MYVSFILVKHLSIFTVSFQIIIAFVNVIDGRGEGGNRQQLLIAANQNKTRPYNDNTGVTYIYKYIHIYNKIQEYLYHKSN